MIHLSTTNDPSSGTGREFAFVLVLTAAGIWLFWPVFPKHYVYDDWIVLHGIWQDGVIGALAKAWNPIGLLHYRPLADTYFVAMYLTFGVSALPSHCILVALQLLNGYLVSILARTLGAAREASFLAGLLFVSIPSLHLDTLLWLVGFYDVAVVALTLTAVLSFLRDRPFLTLLFTALALLTKEAAVFLPPLLCTWALVRRRPPARFAMPLMVLFVLYAIVKSAGRSPFQLDMGNAHAMTLSPEHSAALLITYGKWLAASLAPYLESRTSFPVLALLCAALALQWRFGRRYAGSRVSTMNFSLLVCWAFLALLPVLLLRNQAARYYAVHTAVPLCIVFAVIVSESTSALSRKGASVVLVLVAGVVFAGNLFFTTGVFSMGINEPIRDDGRFHLVKRGAAVDSLYENLFMRHPTIPSHFHIHVTGIPLDAIGGDAAVQLWYRDTTLVVDVGVDSSASASALPSRLVSVDISP